MVISFKGTGGGGSYTLPIASQSTLGGVKVGENLSINENGVLSSNGGGIQVVDTLPVSGNVGDMVSLKTPYIVDCATWSTTAKTASFSLNINSIWNTEKLIKRYEWHGARPKLFTTTDGKILVKQDYNDAQGTDVLRATIESGSTGSTTFYKNTGHTEQANLFTWDWTSPNVINFTIQNGSTAIELVENPQKKCYKGVLYEYVANGTAIETNVSLSEIENYDGQKYVIYSHSQIPSNYLGTKICDITWLNDYRCSLYFGQNQNEIFAANSADTSVRLNTFSIGDAEQKINMNSTDAYVTYTNSNIILRRVNYIRFKNPITKVSGSNFWKRIDDDSKVSLSKVPVGSGIPTWNEYGQVVKSYGVANKGVRINTNGWSYPTFVMQSDNNMPDRMYFPVVAGAEGQIVKCMGDNAAPVFVDFYNTYTDGIHFRKLTQEEYDALAVKDSNTMYLIIEESE